MVGIVLVSHSRALAEALQNLVRQVSSPDVPLAISAGVGDDRSEFGTDALELMDAIQAVYSPEGVLVLMDLGSAVLSAEVALELLPPEISSVVRLCPAPIVEGAIAAAVQAGLGSDLETIYQEARSALAPKLDHLGIPTAEGQTVPPLPAEPVSGQTGASAEVTLTIVNRYGLHARPAARFVKTAAAFDAAVSVRNLTNGKGPVSARSLNAVATLGAVRDHVIVITAQGKEASLALDTLAEMVKMGFGEIDTDGVALPPDAVSSQSLSLVKPLEAGELHVIPISDGAAVGPFRRYQPPMPPISEIPTGAPQTEWDTLQVAIEKTTSAIRQRQKQLGSSLGEAQAAIFEAHELILQDPDLLEAARAGTFSEKKSAAAAWNQAVSEAEASYRDLEDPYLRQRATDVRDVGNQVLFALSGTADGLRIEFDQPVILFAEELTPTQTAQLDMSKVLGLMTATGGPTSHSAILARALGIPAVTGVQISPELIPQDVTIGLDGFVGAIWIDPSPAQRTLLEQKRLTWMMERDRLLQTSQALAATADGQRVEVVANVGSAEDARSAAKNGAEGIGLLRTEFLFLTRSTPPSEAEQYETLCQVGAALQHPAGQNWPMVVRTLDVGGDKELPYVQLAPEANPFLGVRALRLSLRKPELFFPQLRAILRAGELYPFRVMFPMVANLDEIEQARASLEIAHADLLAQGVPHGWPIEMGIMVEIPSAALLSPLFAAHVDFFSIGTNDLTQYTLAAERGNPLLAGFADGLHPAVLQLIDQVVRASHQHGKWTGVCGELAGDPLATAVLVGLGVDELSMSPGSIPRVKAIIHALDTPTSPHTRPKHTSRRKRQRGAPARQIIL